MPIQTYLVDGDKGGVGKSLTTRALAHYFLSMDVGQRPFIAVFDADMSNPDVCGKDGLSQQNSDVALAQILDLSIEQGWIELANAIEKLQNEYEGEDIRILVNMPAQIGSRAFQGAVPIVAEVLRLADAFPVWLLSRLEEGIRTLEERIRVMPARFQYGLVLRNLFFGEAHKFVLWEGSALRERMLGNDSDPHLDAEPDSYPLSWCENCLPEINDEVIARIGRTPLHIALGNKDGKPFLSHGYRLTLQAWLRKTHLVFAEMEQFIAQRKAAAQAGPEHD